MDADVRWLDEDEERLWRAWVRLNAEMTMRPPSSSSSAAHWLAGMAAPLGSRAMRASMPLVCIFVTEVA